MTPDPVDNPPLWRDFAPDLDAALVTWSDVAPAGAHWSLRVPRGTSLRLVALDAGANLSVVLYAAHQTLERYNMPDTLKAQHTAHLTRGHVLMSDMGRAMASITRDTLGWHDPLGALLDDTRMRARYGRHAYDQHRNGMHRAGREGLLVEIAKFGLAPRDLIAPVNFFSKVAVEGGGRLRYATDHAAAGAMVELRFEMDVLLAWSAAPHPLNPASDYPTARVGLAAWRSGAAPADDHCRAFRPRTRGRFTTPS